MGAGRQGIPFRAASVNVEVGTVMNKLALIFFVAVAGMCGHALAESLRGYSGESYSYTMYRGETYQFDVDSSSFDPQINWIAPVASGCRVRAVPTCGRVTKVVVPCIRYPPSSMHRKQGLRHTGGIVGWG